MMRKRCTLLLISVLAASGCAAAPRSAPARDLVVAGRLESLDYQLAYDPDDLLGHGWITARLHIARVLRGRPPAPVLTVRYFAHTDLSDDRELELTLRPGRDGTWLICAPPGGGVGVQCK